MDRQPINIIRDPQRKCCATCSHASLISIGPYEPLLAECLLQPNIYDDKRHPYIVMVANIEACKQHDWRKQPAVIDYRQKH